MGIELLMIEKAVPNQEQAAYGREAGFLDHVRSAASRALAERIARDASLYRRIDPTEEELRENPWAPVRHRWLIGVERKMSDIEARAAQMDEARRDGLREAAALLREQTAKYEAVSGHCKWVIMSSLRDAATDLDKLAAAPSS
jgi:hypothetical protein